MVTSGAQQALDICVRLLLDPGDHIIVEDPGYVTAHAAFLAAGATLIRVPVDAHGLDPAALPRDGSPVRAIYVTPSHQFPTGAVMPAARRHALIAWAQRRGAYIIEDDYDGEFRYVGRPIAALAGARYRRHASSTAGRSRSRCSRRCASAISRCRRAWRDRGRDTASGSATWARRALLQHTLAQLMATGEYDRHIRRMQKRYRERRQALLAAIKRHFGDSRRRWRRGRAARGGVVAGPAPDRVTALIDECAARGVGVYSIAGHATRRCRAPD